MKKGLFIVGVALLASVRSETTRFETVWLKDVTTRFSSDKRTFSDLDHPDELTFNLRRGSGDITLNLKRNYDIDPNADVYFAGKSKDGQSVLVKAANFGKEDVAYYQDMENGAFVTVRCVKRSNEQCDRDIITGKGDALDTTFASAMGIDITFGFGSVNGNIQIGNSCYDLRPAETEVTSRNLFKVPDLFAKRYVLQDQAHIQRENSVENKGNINQKKAEEELTTVFQRFEAQRKHTQGSFSHAALSSRNIIVLHNNSATDKARQLKKFYYVKVAVLIDSEIWKLHSSLVSSFNPLTRNRKVKGNIQEYYSHVMNGVNLRYKGIQDRSISISVILSSFIYFKRESDFKHKQSKVVKIDGNLNIEVNNYLDDLSLWDQDMSYKPIYDHAMLFTRYYLYDMTKHKYLHGLAFNNDVCDVGGRLSVVKATNYLSTTFVATHELGHNLGAVHDGEENATDCKSEDSFIMTNIPPTVDPDIILSRNFWIFSNCSVEAFKRTLKNKECVTHPGPLYDGQKYREYVTKEPGEVYTPDDQCRLINGPRSVYCGPVPVNSCYLMCTDPSTAMNMCKYHHAARGTQCGQNMFCIESRCVPKPPVRAKASQFFAYQTRDHNDVGSNQFRQDRQPRGILWPKPKRATPSHV